MTAAPNAPPDIYEVTGQLTAFADMTKLGVAEFYQSMKSMSMDSFKDLYTGTFTGRTSSGEPGWARGLEYDFSQLSSDGETRPVYSLQRIFDESVDFMYRQGRRGHAQGAPAYFGGDGEGCVLGHFMREEIRDSVYNTSTIVTRATDRRRRETVYQVTPAAEFSRIAINRENIALLWELQFLHDTRKSSQWQSELIKLGRAYDLDVSRAIDQVPELKPETIHEGAKAKAAHFHAMYHQKGKLADLIVVDEFSFVKQDMFAEDLPEPSASAQDALSYASFYEAFVKPKLFAFPTAIVGKDGNISVKTLEFSG